ncbi:DegT/DnrJ/EryC1/StrS family aminotransferase [Halobacterium yunchengense]|uniref:DegT/DnrJ/EryC1/StrS family aminotransferase n=1 Tax=Halobacterium yunchengense TaxID=3108497 RepID=UPI00300A8913
MTQSTDAREQVPIAAPQIGDAEIDRVVDVLESGQLAAGSEVQAFESEYAEYAGADHAVAAANGTAALHAALEAVGVGDGDTVVTTPFSFVASANAVRHAGAEPAFADVDPETFTLDPVAVEERIRAASGDVDAILAVHLYGLPADVGALADVADDHGVPLVVDAAQAHGAQYDGEPAGSHGDVACFSFYPTKNMTTAEGGMITTDDPDVANAAERFINHGRDRAGYEHVDLGHNFRLTDIAAAIGRAQLRRLPEFNSARRENAAVLTERLSETDLVTPTEPDDRRHVYHQYTVRCGNRSEVASTLEANSVDTGIYYPIPIHQQPTYDDVDCEAPVAEALADEVLSLPVHPGLSERQLDHVCRVLTEEVAADDV